MTPLDVMSAETEDSSSAPAPDWYGNGSWATDPRYSVQEKIGRWQLYVMMRQRNISWAELREELGGISAARLGQMLKSMAESDFVLLRVESAIDAITERRHAAVCTCDDLSCAVYTCCYEDDSLVQAKKGEINEWRKWNAEVLSESTPTASEQRS